MKKYRLKTEAVPFFKVEHSTSIYGWDTWDRLGVDDKALEEVKDAYVSYGHKTSEISSSLAGWGADKGADYRFTIHFPSMKMREYDEFGKGKVIRKLMDEIQRKVDCFFSDFINDSAKSE
jgi:hypothetical protein